MGATSYKMHSKRRRSALCDDVVMPDPQQFSGARDPDPDGGRSHWRVADDDLLRLFLQRPELALVAESCAAEHALHAALQASPSHAVDAAALQALQDADARDSYGLFLRFRDGLLAAGTLEAWYLGLFPRAGGGRIEVPPLFIDMVVDAILDHLLAASHDAHEVRAADMLFRSQRITRQDGQTLAGDRLTLDMLNDTGGVGDIGRFLVEAGAPLPALDLHVLSDANAGDFFAARTGSGRHRFLLDLTHEVRQDLSHGLVFTMTRARSGLTALSAVLQQWVWHFLGVAVAIRPLQKVEDPAWRWHVGLDAEASALLNDLYEGRDVEPDRLQRLVSLFRLDFADPLEMRPEVAGKPVYLGLMSAPDGTVRLKPQNLLLNLPVREVV
ncbi:MAG: hypothetical protein JWQ72_2708 [Polaromonas sp.]|nr:hypothetical protein [Polaromonas sp.]